MSPESSPIQHLTDQLARGQTTATDAARASLATAERANPLVNALTQTFPTEALTSARTLDTHLASHAHPGPLAGIPIVLKDNICLSHGRTTCGSRILENYHSPYTATAAQRLINAGAIIIGKANLDEFAMGSGTERSLFGPTRNPWDTTRTAGGSSGGSAAAVASGIVPAALGSDTGGSIRQPAGMCGVVGFKPTYGRVSRFGLVAYASSLDQIGPFARTVKDAALIASVICGHDPLDATSIPEPAPDLLTHIDEPVSRLVIGVPKQARSSTNHPAVQESLDRAIHAFREMAAEVIEVDLPLTDHGIAAYYIIALAEASSNLARFDGVRYGRRAAAGFSDKGGDLMDLYCQSRAEGFGAEVQRRIMLGTHVLSAGYADAYYNTALKVRRLIRRDFDNAFSGTGGPTGSATGGCHAILMPSSPHPAWTLGAKSADPLSEYLEDVYTVGVNLAGLPAITIPGGLAKGAGSQSRDLPVGVQLIGPFKEDATLLRIARMLEHTADPTWSAPPQSIGP